MEYLILKKQRIKEDIIRRGKKLPPKPAAKPRPPEPELISKRKNK